MKPLIQIIVILVAFVVLSCSAQKKLAGRLAGDWEIAYHEEAKQNEETPSTMTNIGSLSFNKGRSGSKSISYSIMGSEHSDTQGFRWNNSESTVTITRDDASMLTKSWTS